MEKKRKLWIIPVVLGLMALVPVVVAADKKSEAAEDKVAVCAGCHGPNGNSAVPDNPILAGQRADYLASALQAYRSGLRDHGIMKTMANRLSAQDPQDIAAYYAAQPPVQSKARARGEAGAGKGKIAVCAGCHGVDGHSAIPNTPSLAGQHATYLASALKTYKAGGRNNPIMAPIVAALSEQDMEDIAAYYAALAPKK